MNLPNLLPGIIRSYDQQSRLCRVEIPGLTDGAEILPEAEFCSGIGDKSEHTEIHIILGDRVWLSFIGGDPRYPVIMGYRPMNTGNSIDVRRWHHANVEVEAFDGYVTVTAKTDVTVIAQQSNVAVTAARNVAVTAGQHMTINVTGNATVTVGGSTSITSAGPMNLSAPTISMNGITTINGATTINGSTAVNGGLQNNGVNVGSTHTHSGVVPGLAISGPPV